jgi:hypothetical protein
MKPRSFAGLFAVSCVAAYAGSTHAAPSAHGPSAGLAEADTIRGTVFDSLQHRPLAGATVLAEPGGESVVTDDEGRFTILSAARVDRVAVFHDVLDRTGIGSLSSVIDASVRTRGVLLMATPSLATLWSRLCPEIIRQRGREGIVFGVAIAANGSTRVAGVRMRASWDFDSVSQAGQGARVVNTRTDSTGSYYACGVPPMTNVYVIAYSVELSSGTVGLPGDSLPVRRQDLVVGAPGQTVTIHGIVVGPNRAPLAGASVELDGLDGTVTADAAGKFQIIHAPTGTRSMLVRAVGYSPVLQAIDVTEKLGDELRIVLERNVFLPGVKVTERTRVPVLRQEFIERRRMGIGQFIDSTEIKPLYNVRSIFLARPGVQVQGNPPDFTLYFNANGGYCQPLVYLDGFKSDTQVLEAMSKDRIVAVEIYLRPIEVPATWAGVQRSCGAVLVWTKDSFAR